MTVKPFDLSRSSRSVWEGLTAEVRGDYADLMECIVGLPQMPRTEERATAWAVHARALLLDHAAFCARRGLMAAHAGATAVASSWKEAGSDALAMARTLGDLMGLDD
jgi:hypothetical protein